MDIPFSIKIIFLGKHSMNFFFILCDFKWIQWAKGGVKWNTNKNGFRQWYGDIINTRPNQDIPNDTQIYFLSITSFKVSLYTYNIQDKNSIDSDNNNTESFLAPN